MLQLEDGDWLYNKYVNEKLSARKIGEILKYSERTICRKLNEFKIPIRDGRSRYYLMYENCEVKNLKLTRELLIKEYIDNKKSSLDIAKEYNCSDAGIRKQLRKYNIPIRSLKESNLKGKNHWNWKGGRTSLYEQIRKCIKYSEWRFFIFKRDNFTCQKCGDNRGGNLQVDHIIPFIEILNESKIKTLDEALEYDLFWDLENGRTLCIECHKKTKTYGHLVHSYSKEN